MGGLTNDRTVLEMVEEEVKEYMATSREAQRAKQLIEECLEQNSAIRGRYAPACNKRSAKPTGLVIPALQ